MIWQVAIWSVGVIFTAFLGYVNCSFAYALILRNEQYLYVCNEAEFTYPIFYVRLLSALFQFLADTPFEICTPSHYLSGLLSDNCGETVHYIQEDGEQIH